MRTFQSRPHNCSKVKENQEAHIEKDYTSKILKKYKRTKVKGTVYLLIPDRTHGKTYTEKEKVFKITMYSGLQKISFCQLQIRIFLFGKALQLRSRQIK